MDKDIAEPLSHQRGFTFRGANSLLDYWLESWNKTHPLLDIGCGNCTNTYKAAERGITVYATESEQEPLKTLTEAHKNNKNISFSLSTFP